MNTTTHLRQLGAALCLIAGLAASGSGSAQDGGALEVTNAVYQEIEVKAADGRVEKQLVPATKVIPGSDVIYEIAYRNRGKDTAKDVAIGSPVSSALTYVGEVGAPPAAVSVDGGETFGELSRLVVTAEDGRSRPARTSDVTHVRWVIPTVMAGAQGKVSFRARVK